jgi:sarcosine oxidase
MTKRFDVVVAGLGAAGGAALCHLARSGMAAAGFDAWEPPHAHGSSHGETRMIREAYYEDPRYIPLLRRAYDLWHDLARLRGQSLIVETGGVFAGPPEGGFVDGIRRSAREHGIPIEAPARESLAARFPWLSVPDGMETLTEPRAGFLHPERCVAAHLAAARAGGAAIHVNEPVLEWNADDSGITVVTARGRYRADRLVVCTGAWIVATLASAGVAARVTRQALFWFRPRTSSPAPDRVWAIEFTPEKLLYGFPDVGTGCKVAVHYGGTATTADTVDRSVRESEWLEVEALLERYAPALVGTRSNAAVCMYTNTPDLHFVFDAHPAHANVLLVSACSGHGFKFASAIGEAAAQWARDGAPRQDMSLFSLARFGKA